MRNEVVNISSYLPQGIKKPDANYASGFIQLKKNYLTHTNNY